MLHKELKALLEKAATQELAAPDELRERVHKHLRSARLAAANSGLVDLEMAQRVGQGCLALLETWTELEEAQCRLVQEACMYFAESDDDEDDFESVIGFEDDAEVLNHVASRLGRDDLIIELE